MLHTKFFEPVCVWDVKASLGEGVVWIESEQCVYFVNIIEKKIYRYHPETQAKTVWDAPKKPAFIFPTTGFVLLCGMEDGLYWFDPVQGTFTQWFAMNETHPNNRLNDGYIDSLGRLWFGTMDNEEKEPSGSLYLLTYDEDGKISSVLQDKDYVVTNGPVIMENHYILFHNHSNEQVIYKFDWHESGSISNKTSFAVLENGYPDGMASDSQDNLWVCLYAGNQINVYSQDATLLQTIPFPCPNITKITFGGQNYQTAYVTTAIKDMTVQDKQEYPLAGGLFAFDVSVPGKSQNLFKISEHVLLK
ncbi:Sugar lactone lactonase YvrE (YvrE) (PDB:1E1A) [Commensalibacter communis]|uniref:Sugar lactone lactonase YvrE (YvrE) n=1 Tax=Commensalibacter communis TaxID=2972786 RepID=A0A9W4X5Y4_9PROT|nr:SMP-30/gluconolactonase/LRE family protein [Commensalibacter communis]CAI3925294.1 Sugar lactone lactonase YvrE (YvrE) (PDB:1E1A) [Commensalibacter communis]CAI3926810.1 Sugar lactone lactonase YvrE (YvrE) (PDB:1E1A) [Commensalibacter communis]CAI3927879.1 Sugar lactone lactonase YvrE (YvrE) (PDB:1E1A) [Commensalibacter communis]CAI3935667.1 Sugar lactone lactonase YvrE (YvrE) (PDB:1E1A) [Commensalibacter communis]CAI3936192.1 Sugar lactone lactonase YvrE (YvrE) (PDB:1E1A) [Commensalibacter